MMAEDRAPGLPGPGPAAAAKNVPPREADWMACSAAQRATLALFQSEGERPTGSSQELEREMSGAALLPICRALLDRDGRASSSTPLALREAPHRRADLFEVVLARTWNACEGVFPAALVQTALALHLWRPSQPIAGGLVQQMSSAAADGGPAGPCLEAGWTGRGLWVRHLLASWPAGGPDGTDASRSAGWADWEAAAARVVNLVLRDREPASPTAGRPIDLGGRLDELTAQLAGDLPDRPQRSPQGLASGVAARRLRDSVWPEAPAARALADRIASAACASGWFAALGRSLRAITDAPRAPPAALAGRAPDEAPPRAAGADSFFCPASGQVPSHCECARGAPVCARGAPACARGAPACARGSPACARGRPACGCPEAPAEEAETGQRNPRKRAWVEESAGSASRCQSEDRRWKKPRAHASSGGGDGSLANVDAEALEGYHARSLVRRHLAALLPTLWRPARGPPLDPHRAALAPHLPEALCRFLGVYSGADGAIDRVQIEAQLFSRHSDGPPTLEAGVRRELDRALAALVPLKAVGSPRDVLGPAEIFRSFFAGLWRTAVVSSRDAITAPGVAFVCTFLAHCLDSCDEQDARDYAALARLMQCWLDRTRPAPPFVERGPAPFVERGPAPFVERGPVPFVERGPAPFVERGPAPFVDRGAAPFVERGPAPILHPASLHENGPLHERHDPALLDGLWGLGFGARLLEWLLGSQTLSPRRQAAPRPAIRPAQDSASASDDPPTITSFDPAARVTLPLPLMEEAGETAEVREAAGSVSEERWWHIVFLVRLLASVHLHPVLAVVPEGASLSVEDALRIALAPIQHNLVMFRLHDLWVDFDVPFDPSDARACAIFAADAPRARKHRRRGESPNRNEPAPPKTGGRDSNGTRRASGAAARAAHTVWPLDRAARAGLADRVAACLARLVRSADGRDRTAAWFRRAVKRILRSAALDHRTRFTWSAFALLFATALEALPAGRFAADHVPVITDLVAPRAAASRSLRLVHLRNPSGSTFRTISIAEPATAQRCARVALDLAHTHLWRLRFLRLAGLQPTPPANAGPAGPAGPAEPSTFATSGPAIITPHAGAGVALPPPIRALIPARQAAACVAVPAPVIPAGLPPRPAGEQAGEKATSPPARDAAAAAGPAWAGAATDSEMMGGSTSLLAKTASTVDAAGSAEVAPVPASGSAAEQRHENLSSMPGVGSFPRAAADRRPAAGKCTKRVRAEGGAGRAKDSSAERPPAGAPPAPRPKPTLPAPAAIARPAPMPPSATTAPGMTAAPGTTAASGDGKGGEEWDYPAEKPIPTHIRDSPFVSVEEVDCGLCVYDE
jgi:hypothetical protein